MTKDYNSIIPGNHRWMQMYISENFNENSDPVSGNMTCVWPPHSAGLSPMPTMGSPNIGMIQSFNGTGIYDWGGATTAEGLQGFGDAQSYINCGPFLSGYTGVIIFSLRFKLDILFDTGAPGIQILFSQTDDHTGAAHGGNPTYFQVYLDNSDGTLTVDNNFGGGTEQVKTTQSVWNARQWYHALITLDPVGGNMTVTIDNNVTNTAVCTASFGNMTQGNNFTIFNYYDDNAAAYTTTGFEGVITDFVILEDAPMLPTQQTAIYNGVIPNSSGAPQTIVAFYRMDKGRGTTAYDRVSTNNGFAGTSIRWAYNNVRIPAISPDAYNVLPSGFISRDRVLLGDKSVIWLGKIKATYDSAITTHDDVFFQIGGMNNYFELRYNSVSGNLEFRRTAEGVTDTRGYAANFTIDDYAIFVYTYEEDTGNVAFYENGVLQDSASGLTPMGDSAPQVIMCRDSITGSDSPGISKPIMWGIIDGQLSEAQVLLLTARLSSRYGLGI